MLTWLVGKTGEKSESKSSLIRVKVCASLLECYESAC